ncbi:Leucine-rich PPR motif-containing protein, mitochondrial [Mizuhopecten yessoensis]|uniref:Leucine-rich PPR motif-containing protein, mitochondrial n=1 Tax=Mizuhopecten yessoensis TaxID=6573 RepID=A0A210PXR5_MIZYE|nr:Leucine-rich PPR motif-containing protein, mitochondrial [Mizuhopecten yessoensis]
MAASMRVFCRKAPPVYSLFCGPRTLSTMQSMRIPAQTVKRPSKADELDVFVTSMYKMRKNLELRRFIPIVPFIKTSAILKNKTQAGEHISNSQWSDLLSMTGEVLNVRKFRRKRIASNTWNFMKSCKGNGLDVSNFTTYLMVSKENEMEIDITSLKEEMRKAGLSPDQEFFEELVGYHSAHGQLESVKEVIKEMESASYRMTAKTLSNYIWAEFNAGYQDDLTNILESMSCYNVAPDLNCYMTMLKCYAVKGDMSKIEELILTAEKEVGMKQLHRLQLLVPLIFNKHEAIAVKLFGSLCDTHHDVEKSDMTEIEYCGNQLVVNLQLQMGFNVYNLFTRTAPYFIRSYARGPAKKKNVHLQGYGMLDRTAASLTVQMIKNDVVTWDRMLLEAKTISEEYTALIFLEAKKEGILKSGSYEQICTFIETGHSSKYFTSQSREFLKNIAFACLSGESLDLNSKEIKLFFGDLKESRQSKQKLQNTYEKVQSNLNEIEKEIQSGNDDEVLRKFDEMKKGYDERGQSNFAKKLVIMYRDRKKFEQAMHFLDVMVRANPSFPFLSNTLAYLLMEMLEHGEYRGIVKCINNYLDIAIEMKEKMAVIPHSQLMLILKVLVAFLRPAEVFKILGRIRAHHAFFRMESINFLSLYLKRDVSLAVEALEELLKHSQIRRLDYLQIMIELVQEDDQPLIDKVYSIANRREGKPSADVLLTSAYLINDRVEEARQIPSTTTVSDRTLGHVKDVHIIACIILLKSKPDMLNELVHLQDSLGLRQILAEVLKSGVGSHYEGTRKVIIQYMSENPGSALDVMCSSMMEPGQLELEKLKTQMMKKVRCTYLQSIVDVCRSRSGTTEEMGA